MLARVNRNNAVSSYERTLKDAVEKYVADYIPRNNSFTEPIETTLPFFTAPPPPTEGLYHNDFQAIRTAIEEYENEFNQRITDFQARRADLQRMYGTIPLLIRNRIQTRVPTFIPPEPILFYRQNYIPYTSVSSVTLPVGESYGSIAQAESTESIPIENGPELSMNRNLIGTDPITLDDYENGETIEVMYANENKGKRNRGEVVNVKPSMIIKSASIQGLVNRGNAKNPTTRQPIRLRERRTLRLINTSNRTRNTTTSNSSGTSNQSKKGFRFSTKFPYFKTRKNRKSYRRKH